MTPPVDPTALTALADRCRREAFAECTLAEAVESALREAAATLRSLAASVTPVIDGQTQIGTTAKCGCIIDYYGELSVSPHCTKHQTASRVGE